jgi:hypothetical protein
MGFDRKGHTEGFAFAVLGGFEVIKLNLKELRIPI